MLRKKNVDVYVTGSNSKFLSSDILTEFRGRGDEIHIAPLAFSEYYPASGKDKYEAWQEYLFYGGLPHILAEPDNESKEAYLERLNSEIYIRDEKCGYKEIDRPKEVVHSTMNRFFLKFLKPIDIVGL